MSGFRYGLASYAATGRQIVGDPNKPDKVNRKTKDAMEKDPLACRQTKTIYVTDAEYLVVKELIQAMRGKK